MKKIHTLLFICLLSFTNWAQTPDSIPEHDHFTLVSTVLNETRTITVWTPPGYSENSTSYPVLYMLDGGIKEDFPHIANTLSKLIASKSIPPMILVGIENTQRRRDLTGPTQVKKDKKIAPVVGGSEAFRSFIHTELFAEITRRYRVTGERGIIGESLAGLFVVETFLLQPDLFDFYIAMDPSLWWNKHQLVKAAKTHLANLPPTRKQLWFAGSNAKDIFTHTRALAQVLTDSAPETLRWTYSDEPSEQHSTIFRATKERALAWIFTEN